MQPVADFKVILLVWFVPYTAAVTLPVLTTLLFMTYFLSACVCAEQLSVCQCPFCLFVYI